MKLLTSIILFILFTSPAFAYDYDDGNIKMSMFPSGDWILWIGDNIYAIQWIDGKQKTTGTDGTCYWFNGIDFTNC